MGAKEINEIALRLASRVFDQERIENQYRGAFIEAMIEPYLEPYGWRNVSDGWSGWDFEHRNGSRLEIKQSAAQQTWAFPERRTRGAFDIAPRKGYYTEDGSKYVAVPGRSAHTYVFAWNDHYGPGTDHRDPAQWEFYVVATSSLPQEQRTISLSRVKTLAAPVTLPNLGSTTNRVAFPDSEPAAEWVARSPR